MIQMKFSDYQIITDELGFQFVKDNVMVTDQEVGCLMCGRPTRYVEVISEAYFCSDECVKAFYRQML